jgi:predicted helicase
VKAFRWAADRIGDEGVVAFVTNNGFLDGVAFDGMRDHLARDFDALYVLDLGGNVRRNPKLSGTTHNVFGIQVGVSVILLIRRGQGERAGRVYYARTDEMGAARREVRLSWRKLAEDRQRRRMARDCSPTSGTVG